MNKNLIKKGIGIFLMVFVFFWSVVIMINLKNLFDGSGTAILRLFEFYGLCGFNIIFDWMVIERISKKE